MSAVMERAASTAPAITDAAKAGAAAKKAVGVAITHVGELLKLIQGPVEVTERRATLAILGNLLIEKAGTVLTVTASNLEHQLTLKGAAGLVEGEARLTVDGHKLYDILRTLPSEETVKLTLEGPKLVVQCRAAKFRLNTLPAADFPTMKQAEYTQTVTLPQAVLARLLASVQYAMSDHSMQYIMNGVLLETAGNTVVAVATDSHRLAHASERVDANLAAHSVVVPRKVVGLLLRMLADKDDPVELKLGEGQAALTFGGRTLVTKLIEGKYPDYKRVKPTSFSATVPMERDVLIDALQRARPVAGAFGTSKVKAIRLTFQPGTMLVEANNTEDEGSEELEVAYEGEKLEIGFNLDYLAESLANLGEEVTIGLKDGGSSILLTDRTRPNYYGIVMPLRL